MRRLRAARRVLFVDHTAALGGGEVALLNLAGGLDRRRFVPVVALFADGPLAAKLRAAGVETHVLPLGGGVGFVSKDALGPAALLRVGQAVTAARFVWRLAHLVRARRVDLVHTNSLKADVLGGLAARLSGKPLVWHVRDRIERDYLPAAAVAVFRRLCRLLPDYVLANSAATLRTLRPPAQAGGRWRVVHDGVAEGWGSAAAPAPAGRRLVGLVGRISPWKGQHVFLHAAALVRRRFPDAQFQVIGAALFGEQEYERRVRRLVTELGLEGCVEFTGFRDDVPRWVAALEVLVHASTVPEPFGQVVAEGMAAGKALVATDGGGVCEIVIDGATGLLVPMGDAGAMAEAVCRLLADPPWARRLGQAAALRVREQFTIARTAAAVEALYEQILGDDRKSRVGRAGR